MQKLEKSIIEKLPQIPYILDQVGEALSWAREEMDDSAYNHLLEVTMEVTNFVSEISEPHFFKVHYIIASILSAIPDAEKNSRFAKFDTASKAVEEALLNLIVEPGSVEQRGCFKSVMMRLIPLAKTNIDLFTIALIGVKHDLTEITKGMKASNVKSPITCNDYVTILGYALVMANIRMANINMSQHAHKVFNEISVILNNDVNY